MKKKILSFWGLEFLKFLYFAHIFVISVSKPGNRVKNLFFTSSISCCSHGIGEFPPSADLPKRFSSPAFLAGYRQRLGK